MARTPVYSVRLNPSLREKLEETADREGRSLASEIERRLSRSVDDDERQGGAQYAALIRMAAGAGQLIESMTGKKATEDPFTYFAAQAAIHRVISDRMPRPDIEAERALAKAEADLAVILEKHGPDEGLFGGDAGRGMAGLFDTPGAALARWDRMTEAKDKGRKIDLGQEAIITQKAIIEGLTDAIRAGQDAANMAGEWTANLAGLQDSVGKVDLDGNMPTRFPTSETSALVRAALGVMQDEKD